MTAVCWPGPIGATLLGGWLEPAEFSAWRRRLELERLAGHLTMHRQHALRTLLAFVGDRGLFPSDQAVAELAGCCARTVRRAREEARELGLLTWQRTRKLVDGRWRQGSNRYTVAIPDRPLCLSPDGQRVRRGRKEVRKRLSNRVQAALTLPPPGLPSLADAAAASQARFLASWHARRSAVSGVMGGSRQ